MKDMEKMLMGKPKQEGKMSPEDMQAKIEVLHELLKMAHEAMGGKVKHGMDEMQKVSVMAPDHKSLEAGLDKAKELMGEGGMEPDDAMGNHMEQEETPDEEKAEMLEGSSNPDNESDEGSPKEEASESPKEEEEEQSLFSKKPSKEMPKKKKLFSMED